MTDNNVTETDDKVSCSSSSSNTSNSKKLEYLKPNQNHEVDILLFLNPSVLIQTKINYIWTANQYPINTCFFFEGYNGFEAREK